MSSPVSHVLQSAWGRVRLFLHRASAFWRGAAAIALAVFVRLVGRRVHGPRGVRIERGHLVRARPSGPAQDDAAVAERLHATLLDPRTLERVARGLSPELGSGNAGLSGEAIERIRQSIDVRPSGDQKIAISFRAGSAAYAQHGCQELAQLAGQYLEAMTSAASPAAEEDAKRAKALEEKTRELAAFVATHPEVAMNRPDDAAKSSTRRGRERAGCFERADQRFALLSTPRWSSCSKREPSSKLDWPTRRSRKKRLPAVRGILTIRLRRMIPSRCDR